MKKIIITGFLTLLFTFNSATAGITNSTWFDPSIGCVLAGGGAYVATTENQAIIGGAACAITALAIYFLQERGRSIQKSAHDEEVYDLKNALKEVEIQQAQAAARGDDESYSIKVREVVPGYKDSKGNIIAPTIREKLILPGEGMRVGD